MILLPSRIDVQTIKMSTFRFLNLRKVLPFLENTVGHATFWWIGVSWLKKGTVKTRKERREEDVIIC
jgi:hypothetical protein